MISRQEILIEDLCYEIDCIKEDRDHYKKLYEEYKDKYSELLDESIMHSNQMTANMLTFALGKNNG